MAIEIERKFLVNTDEFKKEAFITTRITQGYLSSHPERTVRIRIKGGKAFLTIKGITNKSGTSRYEWENEIELKDAEELIQLCETGIIDKIRYEIKKNNYFFEVDEFSGDNKGLIIAEIELENENDTFEKPYWLGIEVTGDERYYNSSLSKHPFKNW